MPSSPLSSTNGRTTSGVACHHSPWTANTVERCRGWHDITSLGQHTRSNDVGRVMTSPPLDSTHGRQRRAWHDITALGQHTRFNDVGRGMPSSPLGSTHSRMTLGVACHHRLWETHTIEQRRAWHDITSFGQHTRLNDVRRGIPSSPMGSKHGQMMLGVA